MRLGVEKGWSDALARGASAGASSPGTPRITLNHYAEGAAPHPLSRLGSGSHYPDWTALYSDNASWVYAIMFRGVGNQPDAMDLTSEVFLTALKPLRITATVAEVRGYLRATARTVLFAHLRRMWDIGAS